MGAGHSATISSHLISASFCFSSCSSSCSPLTGRRRPPVAGHSALTSPPPPCSGCGGGVFSVILLGVPVSRFPVLSVRCSALGIPLRLQAVLMVSEAVQEPLNPPLAEEGGGAGPRRDDTTHNKDQLVTGWRRVGGLQSEGAANDRSAHRYVTHERVPSASWTRDRKVAHCGIVTCF